jgi:methionyl-tRNA formyltransferase
MARLAYLGTPDMAVPPLRALAGAGHDIALCVTRPNRRRGRGGAETPSPVKEAALDLGIPVTHAMADIADAGVELAVVVAYGRIIPKHLLDAVPMVNVHFSLLPRWRGAAPLERAILAGEAETGVCLMQVEEGLDTGPVYATRRIPIDRSMYLPDLRRRLVDLGSQLLVETLADGLAGLPEPVPQQGEPVTAEKISKEDLHLDWADTARQLERVTRLGRAWTTFRGKRLGILEADAEPGTSEGAPVGSLVGTGVVTGDGLLALHRVQPESRGPMPAGDWIRGIRPTVKERLGSE